MQRRCAQQNEFAMTGHGSSPMDSYGESSLKTMSEPILYGVELEQDAAGNINISFSVSVIPMELASICSNA